MREMSQQRMMLQSPNEAPIPTVAGGSIMIITLMGMLITTILLISYYIIVIKCSLNWRRPAELGRLSDHHRLVFQLSDQRTKLGLGEAAIRSIPIVQFSKDGPVNGCSICLGEFSDGELLRWLPGCGHVFHVSCVDTWLRQSGTCPVCRSDVTVTVVKSTEYSAAGEEREVSKGHGGGVPPMRRPSAVDTLRGPQFVAAIV